jgi:hypothetical protein
VAQNLILIPDDDGGPLGGTGGPDVAQNLILIPDDDGGRLWYRIIGKS